MKVGNASYLPSHIIAIVIINYFLTVPNFIKKPFFNQLVYTANNK